MRTTFLMFLIVLGALVGCHQPDPQLDEFDEPDANESVQSISVNTEEILSRCAEVYASARTLHIIGVLKDFRLGKQRVVPLQWDLERPNRSRLQINMDVALVLAQDYWIYTSQRGKYSRHRQFTKSPIQTASYLLSDGVPMLLADLWNGNPTVFNLGGTGTPWRLDGVDWSFGRQCYVLSMKQFENERPTTFSIWIDQDDVLIRKWAIRSGNLERPVVECAFYSVDVNSRLPPDTFLLEPPQPLTSAPANVTTRPARR